METIVRKNNKSFDFINEQVNKKSINKLLAQIYLEFGGAKTRKSSTLERLTVISNEGAG